MADDDCPYTALCTVMLAQTDNKAQRVEVGREEDMQLTWLPTAVERGAGVVNGSENTRSSTKRLGEGATRPAMRLCLR
jgi:hypothetical protein